MPQRKQFSPKTDIVFRMLFGEPKNQEVTKKLLEDILEEEVDTIDLEQNPYLLGEQANDKVGVIDVKAVMNGKNPIDIEMQVSEQEDLEARILFYWARMYAKQMERGDEYGELNRCISIIILDKPLKSIEDMPLHTKWVIKDSKKGQKVLTKNLEINIIELSKIAQGQYTDRLKKWLCFLENPYGEETRKMAEENKVIKDTLDALEEINADEEKARIIELRQKYIWDKNAELKKAKNDGIKEGIERGIEQGIEREKINIAKKMKEKNIAIDIIIETTGLTKEEIEKL